MVSRGMLPKSKGVIHWSISFVTRNPVLAKSLLDGPYKRQALVPASSWLDNNPPAAPEIEQSKRIDSLDLRWRHGQEADVFHWIVYYQYGTRWEYKILNKNDRELTIPLSVEVNKN